MSIEKEKKLTIKQKAFADFYIQTGNGADSARRAGYSLKTAHVIANDNLKKANVKEYIAKRLVQLDAEAIAKQEEALKIITNVMRDDFAKNTDKLRACELLLRINNAFAPEKTASDVTINIGFDDEEEEIEEDE